MKIAILGTRGIPNNYGGFEQNAENLSQWWVRLGHEVTVYNPDYHPYKDKEWRGVRIRHVFSREDKLGMIGTLLYDYLCLKDAVKKDYDVILNLGYAPSSLFFFLKNRSRAKFVTNMDGLEWKRSKWNKIMKEFLKFCERRAVELSDFLIADNPGIEDYLKNKYHVKKIKYIAYGATLYDNPQVSYLEEFGLKPYKYYMLVARLEPENNIDIILEGYVKSGAEEPFIVVGGTRNKFAKYLINKYGKYSNIKFVGGIYDYDKLSTLRWFSKLYFHGHSVGGTNPSLLEAMASNAYIVAHDNVFNRYVLGNDAFYFRTSSDVANIIKAYPQDLREKFTTNNRNKIKNIYNWEIVSKQYLEVFREVLKR